MESSTVKPQPPDEPRNHRWFLILVGIISLLAVPFVFIGREVVFFLGLPIWLWWSITFTLALGALNIWGILRYWKDDRFD